MVKDMIVYFNVLNNSLMKAKASEMVIGISASSDYVCC